MQFCNCMLFAEFARFARVFSKCTPWRFESLVFIVVSSIHSLNHMTKCVKIHTKFSNFSVFQIKQLYSSNGDGDSIRFLFDFVPDWQHSFRECNWLWMASSHNRPFDRNYDATHIFRVTKQQSINNSVHPNEIYHNYFHRNSFISFFPLFSIIQLTNNVDIVFLFPRFMYSISISLRPFRHQCHHNNTTTTSSTINQP